MRILFLDSPAFAKQDMIDAFTACGITCDLFFHEAYNDRQNVSYEEKFDAAVSRFSYDFVFSFNYFPILSNCCMKHHLKYISYVYDSPLVTLYSYTLINSCNYVFLFDKATYLEFHNAGIPTVYYLPLAANVSRLSAMKCPDALLPQVSSDACPYQPLPDGTESAAFVYANYFLCRKITSNERLSLLRLASDRFPLKLYTHHPSPLLPKAEYIGPVDYYDTMPYIFQHSRINLNITLKSIHSGIPLRCMDIMGSGGFLLTNYQEDFLDDFQPGVDLVFYESEDAERRQIAANCLGKMSESHTFVHRVNAMLNVI